MFLVASDEEDEVPSLRCSEVPVLEVINPLSPSQQSQQSHIQCLCSGAAASATVRLLQHRYLLLSFYDVCMYTGVFYLHCPYLRLSSPYRLLQPLFCLALCVSCLWCYINKFIIVLSLLYHVALHLHDF